MNGGVVSSQVYKQRFEIEKKGFVPVRLYLGHQAWQYLQKDLNWIRYFDWGGDPRKDVRFMGLRVFLVDDPEHVYVAGEAQ